MKMTIEQALGLEADGKKIRPITKEDLTSTETDVGTYRAMDVIDHFEETIREKLGHLSIDDIELWGSHIEITSVNGQVVYISPGHTDPKRDMYKEVDPDEKMELGVKYNRIFASVKVGIEKDLTDTLFCMYSLDRKKFQIAHGKTITINQTMCVPWEEAVFKGTPKDISSAIEKFSDYLSNWYDHTVNMESEILRFRNVFLDLREVNHVFTEHFYRSALIAQGLRKGVQQVFDDNTLKEAIYLLYNTIHPYRAKNNDDDAEVELPYHKFGKILGSTTYDLYCCFTEALSLNNNDLVKTIDKQLNCFAYFNALNQRAAPALPLIYESDESEI